MEINEFPPLVINYFLSTYDFIFSLSKLKQFYGLENYDISKVSTAAVLKETFNHLYLTLTNKYKGTHPHFLKAELGEFFINFLSLVIRNVNITSVTTIGLNELHSKLSYLRFLLYLGFDENLNNLTNQFENIEEIKIYVSILLGNLIEVLFVYFTKKGKVDINELYKRCLRIL